MPDLNDESRSRTYTGQLNSAPLTGRAEFFAAEDALEINAGGQTVRLPYSSVQSLSHENFTVCAETDDGVFEFSRLGTEEDWFYDEFLKALNLKVQTSFFEIGAPLLEIEARCLLADETGQSGGRAVVRVFDDCLLLLTPDRSSRRLPLGFLKVLQKESYAVRMTFDSGENLNLFEAGFDLTPLLDTVDLALNRLAKNRATDLKSLLPALPSSEIARLIAAYRMNTAIPISGIPAALEEAIRSRFTGNLAVTYPRLKTLGDSTRLALGFAAMAEGEFSYSGASADESEMPNLQPSSDASPYIFWAVLPSEDHKYAALELCLPEKAAAATYIFRTDGTYEDFLLLFNRAFEACRFRREFLTFTDAELLAEGAGSYKILIDRTPSLQRLRSLTAGRIIHSSPDAWEQKLRKAFAGNAGIGGICEDPTGTAVSAPLTAPTRFCPACGCRISSSVRFCTECGKKL